MDEQEAASDEISLSLQATYVFAESLRAAERDTTNYRRKAILAAVGVWSMPEVSPIQGDQELALLAASLSQVVPGL